MGSFPTRQGDADATRKSKREAERKRAIAAAIRQLEENAVTDLSICKLHLGDDAAKEIAAALERNSVVSAVNLSFSSIHLEGIVALAAALSTSGSRVTMVDISGNRCGPEGAKAMADMLRTNSQVVTLNFGGMDFEDAGFSSLAAALQVNTSTTSLDVSSNLLGPESACKVGGMLSSSTSLVILKMGRNNFLPTGVEALAPALQVNAYLHVLNLAFSQIRTEGAIKIGQALLANSALTDLDLSGNAIKDPGAYALANALRFNSVLSSLLLQHNLIGTAGGIEFLGALEANTTVVTLGLRGNPIELEVLVEISDSTSEEGMVQRRDARARREGVPLTSPSSDYTATGAHTSGLLAATRRFANYQRRQRSLGNESEGWCEVQRVRPAR